MALVGNYNLLNKLPLRFRGGATLADSRSNYSMSGSNRNQYLGGYSKLSATPSGYLHPYSWIMPYYAGQMATYTLANGQLSKTDANLAAGRNLEANTSLTITVTNAQLDQIVSFIASGSCSISVVNAILGNVATLQANGTMQLTSDALCGAIFTVTANGNGQVTGSPFLSALAHLEAESGGPTPLSPEGLAQAVWSEDLTPYSGVSAGQALKDAGSAGNPWSATLASNNTPNTFGWFVQKLLTVAKFLGLK